MTYSTTGSEHKKQFGLLLKGYSTFFWEIGSFYHSPRVKQLSFTAFESIQPFFFFYI